MSDEPVGQDEVKETQVEEKPQVEVPATDKPAEEGLPEDASERTKSEFEKLKAHNKELAEKVKALAPTPESVFDSLRPKQPGAQQPSPVGNLTTQQVGDISQALIDDKGYLDENALSKALRDANDRATRAEVEAQKTRNAFRQFEEKEQVRSTHTKFPQLDRNSDSFDPKFFELTRNEMIGQMMRGEQDYLKAAEKVDMVLAVKPESKKPDQKANIEQINASVKSQKGSPVDENLLRRVQRGDKGALAELLNQTGN